MKSIKKSVAVITVVAAVLGMSVFAFGAASSKNSKDKDVIKSGVRIESIDVSDLTEEEANTKVKAYVKEKTNVPVKIDVNGTEVKTNLSDLGAYNSSNLTLPASKLPSSYESNSDFAKQNAPSSSTPSSIVTFCKA